MIDGLLQTRLASVVSIVVEGSGGAVVALEDLGGVLDFGAVAGILPTNERSTLPVTIVGIDTSVAVEEKGGGNQTVSGPHHLVPINNVEREGMVKTNIGREKSRTRGILALTISTKEGILVESQPFNIIFVIPGVSIEDGGLESLGCSTEVVASIKRITPNAPNRFILALIIDVIVQKQHGVGDIKVTGRGIFIINFSIFGFKFSSLGEETNKFCLRFFRLRFKSNFGGGRSGSASVI